MATNVRLLARQEANFTMEQQSADPQIAWQITIPGGTLGSINSIELLLQIGTRSVASIFEAKRQGLAQVAITPSTGLLGVPMIDLGPGGSEQIYARVMIGAYSVGEGSIVRYDRMNSVTTVFHDPYPFGGGTWIDVWNLTANRPLFAGDGFSGTPSVYMAGIWEMSDDGYTLVCAEGTGLHISHGVMTAFDDVIYTFNGYTNIGGGGPNELRKVNLISGTAIASTVVGAPPFDGNVWIAAAQATEDKLYAMSVGYNGGGEQILKINVDTLAVEDAYDVSGHGYVETLCVVNDDLIYFTAQISNTDPLQVWAWSGGTDGEAVLIDDDVDNWSFNIIAGYFTPFASFKQLHTQVINGQRFLYFTGKQVGTIRKIGPIGPRIPTC